MLIEAASASVFMLLIEKSKRALRLAKVLVVVQRSPEDCETSHKPGNHSCLFTQSVDGCRSRGGIDVKTTEIGVDALQPLGPFAGNQRLAPGYGYQMFPRVQTSAERRHTEVRGRLDSNGRSQVLNMLSGAC